MRITKELEKLLTRKEIHMLRILSDEESTQEELETARLMLDFIQEIREL